MTSIKEIIRKIKGRVKRRPRPSGPARPEV